MREINANLKQGGLEIIIGMEVKWVMLNVKKVKCEKGIVVLKNHVKSFSYLVYDDYKDSYSEILKEILLNT